jgi:hypothetical protein
MNNSNKLNEIHQNSKDCWTYGRLWEGSMRGQKMYLGVTRRTSVDRDSQPSNNSAGGPSTRCNDATPHLEVSTDEVLIDRSLADAKEGIPRPRWHLEDAS